MMHNLSWYRLQIELINARLVSATQAHPVSIFEAIIKGTSKSINYTQPVIFHIKGKGHTLKIRYQQRVLLEVLFFLCNSEDVQLWRNALVDYLGNAETGENYDLLSISDVEKRTLQQLYLEIGEMPAEGEVCLDFHMPFYFKHDKDKPRTYLSKEAFVSAYINRFKRLFGVGFEAHCLEGFHLLPYYWHYTEIKHPSHSQKGHTQYINGCVGKLYIKGKFSDLMPLLVLGSEVHTGVKLSNSYGYYTLHKEPPNYFDRRILNKGVIVAVIQDVLERYDVTDLIKKGCRPSQSSTLELNEEGFAEEILKGLITDTYMPEPNTAFRLQKKDGSYRVVEQLSLKDLVVSQLLLKFLSDPFDRILENSAIGFRKGISRLKAIELFKEAVNEGYHYVIESDIEDFFPSVNLGILQLLIDHYVPSKDVVTKATIKKLLYNGYTDSGKVYERLKGLAQGSPLSPLFANLYLDTFDEQIAEMGLRLIRYADDFVILARSRQEAEEALQKAESFLSDLGLKLKRQKTAIKSVFDGFDFLGIRFDKGEITVKSDEEVRSYKKPLYITEPYVYISLNGDTINIKKDNTTVESLPIRRISEIIAMGNVAFSSSLIKRCTECDIPLTFTLGSGYFITTIKPDRKAHFEISYIHASKYYGLSEAEKLAIAKEIVLAKIENYLSLFKSKRLPADNAIYSTLHKALSFVEESSDINALRGVEGITSRKVFEALNMLIDNPVFHIRNRKRDTPDRINSLLNLAHYLIFSRINATIRAVGLNPYLGFLHEPDNRYESLAADIQEPFRAQTEGAIIKILNLRVIKEEDFTESEKGFYLKRDAIKVFINSFEAELERKSRKDVPSLKDQIYYQIVRVKQYMLEGQHLIFYRWKG